MTFAKSLCANFSHRNTERGNGASVAARIFATRSLRAAATRLSEASPRILRRRAHNANNKGSSTDANKNAKEVSSVVGGVRSAGQPQQQQQPQRTSDDEAKEERRGEKYATSSYHKRY